MKRQITIGEIAEINANALTQRDIFQEIMYLDTGNITRNEIDNIQVLNVMLDKIPSRAKRKVKDKTIIYSTVRPNQEHYGFLENPGDNFIVSTGFSTIDVYDKNTDGKFIYYLLTQKHITDYLHTIGENSVSSYPSINPDDIANLKFTVPDIETQQSIAAVLSALDKKIALNKQINAHLEEMAKTLYDYWFVQFDFPDANGKPYKSSGGEMVFDETLKREIPKGWEVKSLGDWAEIRKGTLITEETANTNGDIKVISAGVDFSYYHDVANRPKNTITISASGANAGFVNFWREPIFACDCTTITNTVIGNTLYILNFLKLVQDFIYQQARGSAQPHVYPKDIEGLKIIVPPDLLLKRFSEFVENWNLKITNNGKQTHRLSQLHDFLLPMLMNGQVSVAE